MNLPRMAARGVLGRVDSAYRLARRLEPAGEILLVGRQCYRGPGCQFDDGTLVLDGQMIGVLHFDNRAFRYLDARSARSAALSFARALRRSLQALADLNRHDERWRDIPAFHAVSWLPSHGARVGFETRPIPDGFRKTALRAYFRMLVWAFATAEESRFGKVDPHEYWLTSQALQHHHALIGAPSDEHCLDTAP